MTTSTTLHAQGLCRGCGERYLFLAGPETRPGMTVETNHYCECEEPQANVVAVVYEPDLYELVDTYGDGAIGLRATCVACEAALYGPVTECLACGCETFNRWLESDHE